MADRDTMPAGASGTVTCQQGFLTDKDLVQLKDELFENLPNPPNEDWYDRGSAIQPAAVDLHVGKIYVPGVQSGERGSAVQPIKDAFDLAPGRTALVETREIVKLRKNVLGIAFAPTRLALNGILTPTLGQVDPGWNGPLKVVVINMGGGNVTLTAATDAAKLTHIATLHMYCLNKPVSFDHGARHKSSTRIRQKDLDRLAPVFADFEKTARDTAALISERYERRVRNQIFFAGIIGIFLAGILVPIVTISVPAVYDRWMSHTDTISAIESRLDRIENLLGKIPTK